MSVSCSQTALYATGAGLGAAKPKDITKLASDYTGYVNLAKDAVRLPQCCCSGNNAYLFFRLVSGMGAKL